MESGQIFQQAQLYSYMKRLTVKSSAIFLLMLSLIMLVPSCVPLENQKTNERSVAEQSGSSSPSSPVPSDSPLPNNTPALYWFAGGDNSGTTIRVNESIQTVIYLRGQEVHSYLALHDRPHCLVINFIADGQKKHLRARAIPITFTPFGSGQTERLFRIDLPQTTDNQDLCSGSAPWFNANGQQDGHALAVAFDPTELCSSCSGIITSSHVSLHRIEGSLPGVEPSNLVASSSLDLTGLTLRIDVSGATSSPVTTDCTQISCQTQGFDCCIDGQCANDGSLRPEVDQSSASFIAALVEMEENPARFLDYPEYFFICPQTSPSPPSGPGGSGSDPSDDAAKRFSKLKREFLCLQQGKKEEGEQNFGVGYCSDPSIETQNLCLLENEEWFFFCAVGQCSEANYFTQTDCQNAGGSWEDFYDGRGGTIENGLVEAHDLIRSDVWARCGCEADPFPNDPSELHCPDFGLKAIYDPLGNITQITCDVPDPAIDPPPFQDLMFNLSSRTTPHRFFDREGNNFDNITPLYNSSTMQEGEQFFYNDESSKAIPQVTHFAMNAILGQMSVQLNRARPAEMIHVEESQNYVISAISGNFTPCPMCASDNWFSPFRPYPATQGGAGLRASGFTTSRSTPSDNLGLGNYEDTIFGRACWIPPTMIPFSHRSFSNLQQQRLSRLTTQAALYINGYQRDWFGFNQGALIGSFDGVRWFAIGNGRRVNATSNKLFLAINAPFADLSDSSSLNVQIIEDLGQNVVANFDYDPELSLSHPKQNQGGTCQAYHQCEVDSDCVTKLGWEYTCVDVNRYKTLWPRFDINANERVDIEQTINSLSNIVLEPPSVDNSRRCVYRGRGAICNRGNWNASGANAELAKALRCAPNFYCASLSESSFSKELVRSPNEFNQILFGQQSQVLGRPLEYLRGNSALSVDGEQLNTSFDVDIRAQLEHNLSLMATNHFASNDMGICLPGKRLAQNLQTQHTERDPAGRTDYISQISSCNSNVQGLERYQTCPIFDEDGNYDYSDNSNGLSSRQKRARQNMCGGESRYFDFFGDLVSSFREIEAAPLPALAHLMNPSLVQDACLRRAGNVCHTNLDCGPNRKHSALAFQLGRDAFGGTLAEQRFWQEELICAQGATPPAAGSEEAEDFEMELNRCCRAIGQNFSMYTAYNPNPALPNPPVIVRDYLENPGLDPFKSAARDSVDGLQGEGRYSRYAGLVGLNSNDYPAPRVQASNAPVPNQWRTLNKTGQQTCCGGGWIRQFADGSTDWSNTQRLNIPVETFQHINYPWNFDEFMPDDVNPNNVLRDASRFCRAAGLQGCHQVPLYFDDEDPYAVVSPRRIDPEATLNTMINLEGPPFYNYNHYAFYQPRRYLNRRPQVTPEALEGFPLIIDLNNDRYDGCDAKEPASFDCHGISLYLPSYIPINHIGPGVSVNQSYGHYILSPTGISNIRIIYFNEDGQEISALSGDAAKWGPRNTATENHCIIATNAANPQSSWVNLYYRDNSNGYFLDDSLSLITYNGGLGFADNEYGEWCVNRDQVCLDSDGEPTTEYRTKALCEGVGYTWSVGDYDVLHVRVNPKELYFNPNVRGAALEITFEPRGSGEPDPAFDFSGDHPLTAASFPGSSLYYESKLGRMELLGIPQIPHDPIYTSHDVNRLLPGLYNFETRTQFESNWNRHTFQGYDLVENLYESITRVNPGSSGYLYLNADQKISDAPSPRTNPGRYAAYHTAINHPPIFSDSEFRCCRELGFEAASDADCCSGFRDQEGICKLSDNTNLHVYFNKFVSSEGMREDLDDPLTVDDFTPGSGEPRLNEEVDQKIANLGIKFCASGEVVRGGSSGHFNAGRNGLQPSPDNSDPNNPEAHLYLAMVDSIFARDELTGAGFEEFFAHGRRWFHHYYCAPGSGGAGASGGSGQAR